VVTPEALLDTLLEVLDEPKLAACHHIKSSSIIVKDQFRRTQL